MAGLTDMLMSQLGGKGLLSQIGGQLNTDEQTAGAATNAAVAALMGALSKNASSEDGAKALSEALSKKHDGGVLDNLQGFLSSGGSADGDGILKHVLGNKRAALERGLGKSTGLDAGAAGKLLSMVAPLVLGALGREQRQQGLGTQALSQLLGSERSALEQKSPQAMGALSGLLDSDGDGDVDFGDIVKQGKGLLGKFLGR
jgi:hypothetical protein